jgi:hypothetical protein
MLKHTYNVPSTVSDPKDSAITNSKTQEGEKVVLFAFIEFIL